MELEGGKNKPLSKKTKFDFFSSGSYGCTSYPEISCDGGVDNKNKSSSLSKLTLNDAYSNNEYEIGKIFKSLKMYPEHEKYLKHILYVNKRCSIDKQKVSINKKKYKCKIIEKTKNSHHNKFMLLYIDYLQSTEFSKVLKRTKTNKSLIKLLLKYYLFMIKMIEYLCSQNIVHHDLHLSNILVEKNTDSFYIIDFGHGLMIDKLIDSQGKINEEYANRLLHDFDPTWPYWPIEYHILTYYYYENKQLSIEKIKEIVDEYYDNVKLFHKLYNNNQLKKYKSKVVDFIKEKFMNDDSIDEKIVSIIKDSYKTWDLYQTNYLMLSSLFRYEINFSNELISLCKNGLHYNSALRYDPSFYNEQLVILLKSFNNKHPESKKTIYDEIEEININKDISLTTSFLKEVTMTFKRN